MKKLIFIVLMLVLSLKNLYAVNYPTSLDSDTTLYRVFNNIETNLDGAITSGATTITVDSTTGFGATGLIQIENEVISYAGKTGTTFTGCTRGADGTSATAHADNITVYLSIVAGHHNVHTDGIIAVETELGTNPSGSETDVSTRLTTMQTDIDAVDSSEITDGTIVNADINASAAIAFSKLAALASGNIIVGSSGNVPTSVAVSGDLSISNTGVTTIQADSVALGTDTTGNYVTSVATSSPLSGGAAGSEGAVISLSIANAAADGTTKGAASFTASDFDATSGNISIDYTNGQTATGAVKGFLVASDWTTFNNKVSTSRALTVNGTANEISSSAGSQDLSSDRTWTLSLPAAIDLGSKTSLEIPNAAAPTTNIFGQIAGDNDAWAASRGAAQFYDGTANTYLIGVLASDIPSNGQVPKWNTGGTITWENESGGGGGSLTLKEGGSTVDAATTILDFGSGFDLVSSPAGTVAVSLDLTETPVDLSSTQRTGTLNVANGGTANTTFTAYSVLCAGTTATGAFQNVSGLGTSGQVLTSNGSGTLPTWQNVSGGSSTGYGGCRVYNNANISIPNNAFTALTFNTERQDDTSYHSTVSNTGRLTVTNTGWYSISGHINMDANATGDRQLQVYLNGTTAIARQATLPHSSNTANLSVSCEYYMNANDYVELRVYQLSGGNLNVNAVGNESPEFEIVWLGAGSSGSTSLWHPINLMLKNATTTDTNDSIKITGAGAVLSATNIGYISIPHQTTAGQYTTFSVTTDVTIKLTGAVWGAGGNGDLTGGILRVYAINNNGSLAWGVALQGGRTKITDTTTSTTQSAIDLPEEMIVNTALTAGTWPMVEVGWFYANFDDTGGASEDLWDVQTGIDAFRLGSADGFYQPWNPGHTGFSGAVTENIARWTQIGSMVTMELSEEGTSNTTGYTFTAPLKAKNSILYSQGYAKDNGATLNSTPRLAYTSGSNTVTVTSRPDGNTWTASSTKGIAGVWSYQTN